MQSMGFKFEEKKVKQVEKDITYKIVRTLIDDMKNRYIVDAVMCGVPSDRDGINIQVEIYEQWRHLISEELVKNGKIRTGYIRKTRREIEAMSLYNILELRDFYLKRNYDEEDE